jgi:hypothetical protein
MASPDAQLPGSQSAFGHDGTLHPARPPDALWGRSPGDSCETVSALTAVVESSADPDDLPDAWELLASRESARHRVALAEPPKSRAIRDRSVQFPTPVADFGRRVHIIGEA